MHYANDCSWSGKKSDKLKNLDCTTSTMQPILPPLKKHILVLSCPCFRCKEIITSVLYFKGSLTWDFWTSCFFMNLFHPGPYLILGPFQIFTKIHRGICNFVFNSGINDTGNSCSPVSTIPVINYCRCHWHRWLRLVPNFNGFSNTGD